MPTSAERNFALTAAKRKGYTRTMASAATAALLRKIRAFLKRRDMTATQFGLAAASNSSLLVRLESGNVTARTIDKVESFLRRHAPKRRAARALSARR